MHFVTKLSQTSPEEKDLGIGHNRGYTSP